MSHRSLIPALTISLALVGGLVIGIGKSAPVPKGREPQKITETEIQVTPATTDKDQMAKNEKVSLNNIKEMTLAVINYSDSHNGDMPKDITDKSGKKLLSWRVQILPYVEQTELYKQFKLDEPWDSENNLKLVEKMPKIMASPRISVKQAGFTVYQGFAGPGALFESGKKHSFPASIPDGTSQTIMMVESSVAVPWTKPADLPFDPDKDLPDFGKAYGAKPLVALCDGSVRIVNTKTVSATTLKAAITTAGGEVLGTDW